jgi:hypothetical protein
LTEETRSLGVVALALAGELAKLAWCNRVVQDDVALLFLKLLGPNGVRRLGEELNEKLRLHSRSLPPKPKP